MFDKIENKKTRETYPFFTWMDRFVLTDENLRKARDVMYELEAQVSQLSQIHRTPQSANHHSEGPLMTNHIENMLAGLFSICEEGTSLLEIEEFAREKHFKNEFAELEDVICANAATFKAFALLHDIAKYETLSFDAPTGSKGATEGFVTDARLKKDILIDRYVKLLNKFKVENPELSPQEVASQFYDLYQIKIHTKRHAQVAASDGYEAVRQAVEDLCRLTARDRQLLYLMIRYHMEVILFFQNKPDGARYNYLKRIAQKSGIDGDDFLDLQAAALFLDTTIGSIEYKDGKFNAQTEIILNMFRSEELADENRRKARVQKLEDKKQREFKKMMQGVGLGGEEVFELLNIGFGPERAGILEKIEQSVKTGDLSDLGEYKEKLYSQIQEAHLLYRSRME